MHKERIPFLVIAFGILLIFLSSCTKTPPSQILPPEFPEITPYPHTNPLPKSIATEIDGAYGKFDPAWPQWWSCYRCADYRLAGGIWKLEFNKGIMRIYYEMTGWHNTISYTIEDEQLLIFNDAYCPQVTGRYAWQITEGQLKLEVIEDPCSINLRGKNLSAQSWNLCSDELTDDLQSGCSETYTPPESIVAPENLTVNIYGGDARLYSKAPDVIVSANISEKYQPEGFQITRGETNIPYGLNMILWGDEAWFEVTTEQPFQSIGVQFFGDYMIGWASIYFDDTLAWQGNTAEIWSKHRYHGGYVEFTDFAPGEHSIRVECTIPCVRPAAVSFIGFIEEGRVEVSD